jgi:Glu-tRNA(Gln) amidotransferase subunit E-like FAD-binding protein
MQKMLYPYLPEPMRNPDSIEWMLNNPEVRKQMESVFAQSGMGMSPEMMNMMSQMDFSQEKVQQQFNDLGLKPEDVIQKVLATPDLASGFSNPKVQQAIFDISQNPMNITKYQNDPEVMKVLEKVTEIFAPQMQGQH